MHSFENSNVALYRRVEQHEPTMTALRGLARPASTQRSARLCWRNLLSSAKAISRDTDLDSKSLAAARNESLPNWSFSRRKACFSLIIHEHIRFLMRCIRYIFVEDHGCYIYMFWVPGTTQEYLLKYQRKF